MGKPCRVCLHGDGFAEYFRMVVQHDGFPKMIVGCITHATGWHFFIVGAVWRIEIDQVVIGFSGIKHIALYDFVLRANRKTLGQFELNVIV